MRQLTQNEIKTRPLWAKSYAIHAQSGEPMFYAYLGYGATPIPRKEFDIHSVRLSDDNIDCLGHCDNKKLWTYFKDDTYYTSETREDIIAKAKHFKLTADDLR